jgi:hypothetical protein
VNQLESSEQDVLVGGAGVAEMVVDVARVRDGVHLVRVVYLATAGLYPRLGPGHARVQQRHQQHRQQDTR